MIQPDSIAVVIVTYKGARWISGCLESLANNNATCSIIVVDNNSTDDTLQIIAENFPTVILIRNQENKGFGQANNIGINHALAMKAEYIFLLNQDTTVGPDTIGTLVNSIKKNSNEFGVVSPLHLNDDATDLDEGFRNFLRESLSDAEIDRLRRSVTNDILEIGFVNAAAWMIPANVFRNIGGFAPLFFHYGEDRDFISRISFHGYKTGVVSGVNIQHYRSGRKSVGDFTLKRKTHYYFVNSLSRAADINRSLLTGVLSGLVWSFKESVFYMLKGKPSVAIASMVAFTRIVQSLPDIMVHRKTVKQPGAGHFLNVDGSK
jgi:GT2 family glycosyltransferase